MAKGLAQDHTTRRRGASARPVRAAGTPSLLPRKKEKDRCVPRLTSPKRPGVRLKGLGTFWAFSPFPDPHGCVSVSAFHQVKGCILSPHFTAFSDDNGTGKIVKGARWKSRRSRGETRSRGVSPGSYYLPRVWAVRFPLFFLRVPLHIFRP